LIKKYAILPRSPYRNLSLMQTYWAATGHFLHGALRSDTCCPVLVKRSASAKRDQVLSVALYSKHNIFVAYRKKSVHSEDYDLIRAYISGTAIVSEFIFRLLGGHHQLLFREDQHYRCIE